MVHRMQIAVERHSAAMGLKAPNMPMPAVARPMATAKAIQVAINPWERRAGTIRLLEAAPTPTPVKITPLAKPRRASGSRASRSVRHLCIDA